METVYTTLTSPDVVAMKMTRGPFFFSQFAGSWRMEPASTTETGRVKVTFRYSFVTRWPMLHRVVDPIIKWVFLRDIRARLQGLKRGAEQAGLLTELGPAAT